VQKEISTEKEYLKDIMKAIEELFTEVYEGEDHI
jgi:hypothetical protein